MRSITSANLLTMKRASSVVITSQPPKKKFKSKWSVAPRGQMGGNVPTTFNKQQILVTSQLPILMFTMLIPLSSRIYQIMQI